MKKVLILSSSPRRTGNSATLAEAAAKGVTDAGHEADFVYLDDFMTGMLRDCRICRHDSGDCGIQDDYRRLLFDHVLPADGWILATPLYWYGPSGALKTFYDRMFCYVARSHPEHAEVVARLLGKRTGLLIACEESYPNATAPLISQIQEICIHLRQELAGTVIGVGNSRGEVRLDPTDPVGRAERLGRELFTARVTDFRLDTERSGKVWS
ncbi:flavodoxin family protein [[Mycobacterium] burgundiense]|uniref:Flavodoxin family protein n=1 Tax=[Mycobacterium] burgundiense TaxID=3064286 RepID=A0ABM9LC04_9MYCO|nr:flavodoxin family protein [Mycolicibacterium sp. MU0053]CAJ1496419.1 flavodoxin family protein [Mycolicibacterium sp. MU0053]